MPLPDITDEDLHSLRAYDWPGNIRELKNIIERCLLLKRNPMQCIDPQAFNGTGSTGNGEASGERLEDIEKQHILNVLNVLLAYWCRYQTMVEKDLLLCTKPGSAPTRIVDLISELTTEK